MNDLTLPLSGLSSVGGKSVVARFDGGMLSSDSGVLALAEVEKRLRVADRLARCIDDPRSPDQVIHNFADMIGFRMKMIAAGYEDGNDANRLRSDPVFKMAQDAPPSGRDLASQSTMCRLENLPDVRSLLAMGRTMVDLYCASFRQIPKRIVLDIDDTFDAVHGNQQLRLFNAHHDEYGFQPIVVFDGDGRFVSAVLRPAKRPSGAEIRAHLRRLVRAIRSNWPNIRILIRADGHYCSPQIIDWCRANDVDFILGVPPTTTLRKHVADLEARTTARFEASPKTNKVRRFKEFLDGAASWSRVERIIA
ncbi:IS1380 family transposase, partial [Mesorhizobium sp. M0019]